MFYDNEIITHFATSQYRKRQVDLQLEIKINGVSGNHLNGEEWELTVVITLPFHFSF